MNEEYNIIIKQLKENISKLITLYKSEKELNKNLTNEINIKNKDLETYIENYQEIEKKYESLKLARALEDGSESQHNAKIKLNRIIREVDNCIALINK
jgi:hypothetical protein